jgi:tRNA A-37 threonylcarbamoyl transferase component Bud32
VHISSNANLKDSEEIANADERLIEVPTNELKRTAKTQARVRVPSLAINLVTPELPRQEARRRRNEEWKAQRRSNCKSETIPEKPKETEENGKVEEVQVGQMKPRVSLKITPTPSRQSLGILPDVFTRTPSSTVSRQNSQAQLNSKHFFELARLQLDDILVGKAAVSSAMSAATSRMESPGLLSSTSRRRPSMFLLPLSHSPSVTHSRMNSNRNLADFEIPRLFTASSIASETGRQFAFGLRRSDIAIMQVVSSDCLQVNQYVLEARIAKCSTGVVYSARDTQLGERRAVKVFNKKQLKRRLIGRRTCLQKLRREIEQLSSLSHPNIIKAYEIIESEFKNDAYLVLELAANGCIRHVCPMSEDDAWVYFSQLVSALDFLHNEAQLVHRDIQPHNLMLDSDYRLKLMGFGASQSIHSEEVSTSGSNVFMAPELVSGAKILDGTALDVWGAGMTLYYFIEGRRPFHSRKSSKLHEQMEPELHQQSPHHPRVLSHQSVPAVYPSHIKEPLRSLLVQMLEKDPVKRIKLRDILEHPWVKRP